MLKWRVNKIASAETELEEFLSNFFIDFRQMVAVLWIEKKCVFKCVI